MITNYVNYVIFFSEPAEYSFALAVAGGPLLALAPRSAATLFGIPFPYPSGPMDSITKGIYFFAPQTPGAAITWGPNPTGFTYNDTIDQIGPVPAQPGTPASSWPANSPAKDGLFVWSGNIVFSLGAGAAGDEIPPSPIAQRRFCIGFESGETQLEGSGSATASWTSRDASRTIEGKGLAIRGNNFNFLNVTTNAIRTGLVTNTSQERFYIRVRKLPALTGIGFWRTHAATAPACGFRLRLNTDGSIKGSSVNNIGSEFDAGVVFTPTINTWYRVDVFIKYATGLGSSGKVFIYINQVLAFTYTETSGFGINAATGHVSTDFGRENGADLECEIDLDDWISMDLPTYMDPLTLLFSGKHSMDWILGSHVRRHFITSATQVNYTPVNSFGLLNQGDNPAQQQGELTSSTSGAQIVGLTDAPLNTQPDTLANILGAVSATVGISSRNAGATDGKLGYKIAGGAAVLTTINELGARVQNYIGYQPTGVVFPTEISPFSVVYEKSADVNAAVVTDISAVVEYIGIFGSEDDPTFTFPISRLTFLHNSPYFNTEWGYVGSEPDTPVFAKGGTYVGNGQTLTVPLPGPCHFIWIRNIDGGGAGVVVWASPNLGGAKTDSRQVVPSLRVFSDPASGTFNLQVSGTDAMLNQSGKTYQYVVFCDPGMRFNLCGVHDHGIGSSSPKANALINSQFLAEAAFVWPQYCTPGGTGVSSYKGPGIGANRTRALDGSGGATNFINFSAGAVNTLSDAFFDSANQVYSLWRTQDGGPSGCSGNEFVQILSYTGDGISPRNIPLTPISGRVPLFVMVQPDAALNGYFRDPSHVGANSSFITNNGLTVNAITAVAIDQITVQSLLNTLGTVYSVFTICGDTGGMNNGTYSATYCGINPGSPYVAPLAPQGDINVIGNGGLVLNGQPGLLLLRDVSGIYTLITGKRNDTLIDRQTGQPSVDVEIPDPTFKTGYIGG